MGNLPDCADFGLDMKKPRESRGFLDAAERTRTSTGLTPTRPSTQKDLFQILLKHGENCKNDKIATVMHHLMHQNSEKDLKDTLVTLLSVIATTLADHSSGEIPHPEDTNLSGVNAQSPWIHRAASPGRAAATNWRIFSAFL